MCKEKHILFAVDNGLLGIVFDSLEMDFWGFKTLIKNLEKKKKIVGLHVCDTVLWVFAYGTCLDSEGKALIS